MTKYTLILGVVFITGFAMACSSKGGGGTAGSGAAGSGSAGAGTAGAGTAGSGAAGSGTAGMTTACAVSGQSRRDGGVCTCAADSPDVCGTSCVDKMTDPDNCGTCGMKCAVAQTCNGGTCGMTPTMLVPKAAGCMAFHMLLAGTNLYWTDSGNGTVKSIGTAAGAAAVSIATAQMSPSLLRYVATTTTLFWLNKGNDTIMKATIPGGTPAMVYKHTRTVDGGDDGALHGFIVSADGATLYYAYANHIAKMPVAGGASTVILTQADGLPQNMALEGTTMTYGSDLAQDVDGIYLKDGTVSLCGMKNASNNGYCTDGLRMGRSQQSILFDSIFLMSGTAYWAKVGVVASAPTMVANPGDKLDVVISQTAGNYGPITAFTVTSTTAYFAEDGYIEKSALTPNSNTVLVARGQATPGPTAIAADATKIFWENECAIMTMPAP